MKANTLAVIRLEVDRLEKKKASLIHQSDGIHNNLKQAQSQMAEDAEYLNRLRCCAQHPGIGH